MIKRLLAFSVALCSLSAGAAYVELDPPLGWRPGTPASGGYATMVWPRSGVAGPDPKVTFTQGITIYKFEEWDEHTFPAGQTPALQWYSWFEDLFPPAYAQALPRPSIVVAPTVVNVGGHTVRMPAAMRFASNAGRYAARQGFRPGPALLPQMALWVVSAGLQWVWDEASQSWQRTDSPDAVISDGYEYAGNNDRVNHRWFSSPEAACRSDIAYRQSNQSTFRYEFVSARPYSYSMQCTYEAFLLSNGNSAGNSTLSEQFYQRRVSSCPAGWYLTPAGCIQTPQPTTVTQQEFEDGLAPHSPPPEVIPHLPDGVPVEDPKINPQRLPWGDPQPRIVPTGDPVPNPNYDPNGNPTPENQPFLQPGTRIQPSPTPSQPWRVDIQPIVIPVPSGNPAENPDLNPTPDQGTQPDGKPVEKQPLLCEVFPYISACARLGEAPPAEKLPETEVNVQINPDSGWGPDTGSCPAPRVIRPGVQLEYTLICDFASGVRPVLIAFAWFFAGLMLVQAGRKSS